MTLRTRNVTIVVGVALIGLMAVLLLLTAERDPGPPVTLRFVSYDHLKNGVVVQVSNRSNYEVTILSMPAPPQWDANEDSLPAHQMMEFTLQVAKLHQTPIAGVIVSRAETGLHRRVRRFLRRVGVLEHSKEWDVSIPLPPTRRGQISIIDSAERVWRESERLFPGVGAGKEVLSGIGWARSDLTR